MISIIVCSVNKERRAAFAEQVDRTIGLPYELIVIENEIERLSICAAYNKGARKAKYPVLCFSHEDVSFHSSGWGEPLAEALKDKGAGMLGLAGATLMISNPSPWWICNENEEAKKYWRVNYIQSGAHQFAGEDLAGRKEVVSLDGFFLACRRDVWETTGFDEDSFRGFHFYDLDICLSARQAGFKNYVWSGVLIEHHSLGGQNADWIENAEKFHNKWKHSLPQSLVNQMPGADLKIMEQAALVDYIHNLIRYGYLSLAGRYLFRMLLHYKNTVKEQMVVKTYIKRLLHL